MRLAIADPPYLGRAEMFYGERPVHKMNRDGNIDTMHKADRHPDAALWDDPATHRALVANLVANYDGWAIAMCPDNLTHYLQWVPPSPPTRVAVWHDPAVMPNGAHPRRRWEAVIIYPPPGRRRVNHLPGPHVGDVLTAPHGSGGFAGAKPPEWTRWVLDMLGHDQHNDTVTDLFPGSGAVQRVLDQPRLALWNGATAHD